MEDIKRLSTDNVPTMRRVWIHNNDVFGIDEHGEPLILAHLEGNEGAHEITRGARRRGPRKKKDSAENTSPVTVTSDAKKE